MRLLIVESPAKAKTINKYLGSDYKVLASYGHIRDLPSKGGSVIPDENFAMKWELSERGTKCINDIVKQLQSCDELLLATDPDREGEAISWHIREVLREKAKLNVPVKRIVFHEITKTAIKEALLHPRDIDISLVDAYLARRALDYLVGFTLSPILWRKLPGSKSAGRVQSVALRIIVDREFEIEAFKKQEYWTIDAKFQNQSKKEFLAKLTHFNGKKLDKFSITTEKEAHEVRDTLLSKQFSVTSIEKKTVKRNPSPAFITSTLQQEASRKLGFNAKKTMSLAQNLYEGVDIDNETTALITYMRTDSVNLSKEAIEKARSLILSRYGKEFMPDVPRVYQKKVKNAQEAHEAIRPVNMDIIPEEIKSKILPDLYRLYDLIWKRTIASQMSSAEFDQVQVDVAEALQNKDIFRATGNTLKFEGFLKVYEEGKDDTSSQDDDDDEKRLLPALNVGDKPSLGELDANQHFTMPPPRFSEASLVKKLEELGIGRPSTYATILQVLQDRGYVKFEKKLFIPEIRGRLVTSFLISFFEKILEYSFTADLEQSLDDISNGNATKISALQTFWGSFSELVSKTDNIKISDVIDRLNEMLEAFLFPVDENGAPCRVCTECKQGELSLKIGRFGSFIGCSRYPECAYTKKLDSSASSDENGEVMQSDYPKFLGIDPSDNSEITIRKGPYGLYIQKDLKVAAPETSTSETNVQETEKTEQSGEISDQSEPTTDKKTAKKPRAKKGEKKEEKPKPKRSQIPKFISHENMDINTAIALLELPKVVGIHEGSEVKIGIGRFGPYVLFDSKFISIPKPERLLHFTLNDAIEVINKKRNAATSGVAPKGRVKYAKKKN